MADSNPPGEGGAQNRGATMPFRRQALRLAVLLPACYLGVVGLFALLESKLVFPAPGVSRAELKLWARQFGATEVSVRTGDGEDLYGWRLGSSDRLVLYFSGNGSTVGEVETYRAFAEAGLSVMHVNYRGYPGSTGNPSEEGLRADALAAWAEARRTHPAERILIAGHSLGGGVAVALAADRCREGGSERPGALLLMATFSSAVDVARDHYPWLPVGAMMRNRFESLASTGELCCPTLIVHGDRDSLIRIEHGRRLAEAVEGARLVTVPGAEHNDLLLSHPAARKALEELAGGM